MLAGVGGQHAMARPYSTDLRDRVVGSVAAGRSCRATAGLFGVSVASGVKGCQRWGATGGAAPSRWGGWGCVWEEGGGGGCGCGGGRARRTPALGFGGGDGRAGRARHTPASYGAVW